MKDRVLLALDAGYLRAVIQAADFIDNENGSGEKRELSEMTICLIHVAGRLARELEAELYKEDRRPRPTSNQEGTAA